MPRSIFACVIFLLASVASAQRVNSARAVLASRLPEAKLVNIPLSDKTFCRNCQALSKNDRIIYATAELTTVEYENGILAMEFNAPASGEAVLQLAREPVGPYVAGGRPASYDWDEKTQHLERFYVKNAGGAD